MAVLGASYQARSARDQGRYRQFRHMPGLPPIYARHQEFPGTYKSSMTGAAFPTSPSRARGARSPANPQSSGKPYLWLRRLPAVCPWWNKFAQSGRENPHKLAARDECDAGPRSQLSRGSGCAFSPPVAEIRGEFENARSRPVRPQCAHRHRKFERQHLAVEEKRNRTPA